MLSDIWQYVNVTDSWFLRLDQHLLWQVFTDKEWMLWLLVQFVLRVVQVRVGSINIAALC